jgi:hypothetical protein
MARDRSGLPHDFADRAIRDALQNGNNLRALLRAVAPDLAEQLDYAQMQLVKPKYLLDDWRERECDLLVRLPYLDRARSQELLVCVLVEHQSTIDQAMPLRLLLTALCRKDLRKGIAKVFYLIHCPCPGDSLPFHCPCSVHHFVHCFSHRGKGRERAKTGAQARPGHQAEGSVA